jgi:hypothetical protein
MMCFSRAYSPVAAHSSELRCPRLKLLCLALEVEAAWIEGNIHDAGVLLSRRVAIKRLTGRGLGDIDEAQEQALAFHSRYISLLGLRTAAGFALGPLLWCFGGHLAELLTIRGLLLLLVVLLDCTIVDHRLLCLQ